jgi:hypothetical protein
MILTKLKLGTATVLWACLIGGSFTPLGIAQDAKPKPAVGRPLDIDGDAFPDILVASQLPPVNQKGKSQPKIKVRTVDLGRILDLLDRDTDLDGDACPDILLDLGGGTHILLTNYRSHLGGRDPGKDLKPVNPKGKSQPNEKKKSVTWPIELEKEKSVTWPIELEKKKPDLFLDETPKEDGRRKAAAKHDFTNLQRLATALENFNYPENTATTITVWCQGGGKGTSAQVTDAKALDVAPACHLIVDGHYDKEGLDLENVAVVSADGRTTRFVNIQEKFAANKPFGLIVNRGDLVIVLQLRKN